MGSFSIEITVSNWQNRYLPESQRGETVVLEALVDTGAVELALPAEVVERLKLEEVGVMEAETADGAVHRLRVMAVAEVEVQGRKARVEVIELPRGARALLGAIPLEAMDWHVAPRERRLVPNPRSLSGGPLIPLL